MEIVDSDPEIDLNEVLDRRLIAHLSTSTEEGPRHSPVWFLWEDEQLWILANRDRRTFPDRIEREPVCAIGIVDFDPVTGRLHHVGFRGKASIEPLDPARAERLLGRYFQAPTDAWNRERFGDPREWGDEMVFVRFSPTTVVVRDQSYIPPGTGDPPEKTE